MRTTVVPGVASHLPYVDSQRIASIGFGFGGICALDLARSGANLRGAVSVYGHFDPPPSQLTPIQSKLLILRGYRDPVTSQRELRGFEEEMNRAMVDWQGPYLWKCNAHFCNSWSK